QQSPVELPVTLPEFGRRGIVGYRLKTLQGTTHRLDVFLCHARHGPPPNFDFDNAAQIIDVRKIVQIYACGYGRPPRRNFHKAFRLQPSERFANWNVAYSELSFEISHADSLPGSDGTRDDRLAQALGDAVDHRLGYWPRFFDVRAHKPIRDCPRIGR